MKTLNVYVHVDGFDCECCGMYSDDTFTAVIEGKVIANGYHDGHFGYGDWDGCADSMWIKIANALGIDVQFAEYSWQDIATIHLDENNNPQGNIEWKSSVFKPYNETPVEFDSEIQAMCKQYQLHVANIPVKINEKYHYAEEELLWIKLVNVETGEVVVQDSYYPSEHGIEIALKAIFNVETSESYESYDNDYGDDDDYEDFDE